MTGYVMLYVTALLCPLEGGACERVNFSFSSSPQRVLLSCAAAQGELEDEAQEMRHFNCNSR